MAKSYLLKMQFIVSESLRSSATSSALVELLLSGFVFVFKLSQKVTRALVGVDFADFPPGFF